MYFIVQVIYALSLDVSYYRVVDVGQRRKYIIEDRLQPSPMRRREEDIDESNATVYIVYAMRIPQFPSGSFTKMKTSLYDVR